MSLTVALIVVMTIAAGGLVTGYAGFGFNLITVPILTALLGPTEAILLTLMVGALLSALMTWRVRKAVPWRTTVLLLATSLPGVWIGAAIVSHTAPADLQRMVGIAVLGSAFGLWFGFHRRQDHSSHTRNDRGSLSWSVVGFVSGLMVAGAGMSGPPVVWMHSWRRDPHLEARASTVAYVSVVSVIAALALFVSAGSDTVSTVGRLGPLSVPAALLGLWAGAAAFNRFHVFYARVAVIVLVLAGAGGIALSL